MKNIFTIDRFFKFTNQAVELVKYEILELNRAFLRSAFSFVIVLNFICLVSPILFLIIYFAMNPNSSLEILFKTESGATLKSVCEKNYSWLLLTQFVILIIKNYLTKRSL